MEALITKSGTNTAKAKYIERTQCSCNCIDLLCFTVDRIYFLILFQRPARARHDLVNHTSH